MGLFIFCPVPIPRYLIVCVCVLSRGPLLATPWTGVRQTPLAVEFPRQEYGSGLPLVPGPVEQEA